MDTSVYRHMNIGMNTRGKRPLRNMTPSDKVRAIQRIHNGETKASVSRDIGVPESTLRGWCKNEQKLRFMCRQLDTTDQLNFPLGMENPPEKRFRCNNHMQSAHASGDFLYSRLSLNGFQFSPNNNFILEKNPITEIIHKHIDAEINQKHIKDTFIQQTNLIMPDSSLLNRECPQLPLLANSNFLPMLRSSSGHQNDSCSFEVEKVRTTLRMPDVSKINVPLNSKTKIGSNCSSSLGMKDLLQTDIISKASNIAANAKENKIKSIGPLVAEIQNKSGSSLTPFQIPNSVNGDTESNLLEWCKFFNASLNFLALAAAAASLHPNTSCSIRGASANSMLPADNVKSPDNGKLDISIEQSPIPAIYANSDLSNDSYFDSEPEDLSVRSMASKHSSSSNSRSESPGLESSFPQQVTSVPNTVCP
ncbi:protein distal antenna-related [Musca vetustissima]|uniref:protein distal antenna-related n=1 Tax=Musca vetustissima TaxID=27455 RepID=UPI002AB7C0D2|nr:protein distal antenna-related [Musca vetustissima]